MMQKVAKGHDVKRRNSTMLSCPMFPNRQLHHEASCVPAESISKTGHIIWMHQGSICKTKDTRQHQQGPYFHKHLIHYSKKHSWNWAHLNPRLCRCLNDWDRLLRFPVLKIYSNLVGEHEDGRIKEMSPRVAEEERQRHSWSEHQDHKRSQTRLITKMSHVTN